MAVQGPRAMTLCGVWGLREPVANSANLVVRPESSLIVRSDGLGSTASSSTSPTHQVSQSLVNSAPQKPGSSACALIGTGVVAPVRRSYVKYVGYTFLSLGFSTM